MADFALIGTSAAFNGRPTMDGIIKWIDYETLLLIFSMMIFFAIFIVLVATTLQSTLSKYAHNDWHQRTSLTEIRNHFWILLQLNHGRIWRLISILCIMSGIIFMFSDNVMTVLLMTPIGCFGFNPVPVLPFIILNINIAGLTTLIGHPPNLVVTGNITFLKFTMHVCFGVLVALIQTNKGKTFETTLRQLTKMMRNSPSNLKSQFSIDWCEVFVSVSNKDASLLKKVRIILVFIITLFFIELVAIWSIQRLSLRWCSFTGVVLLIHHNPQYTFLFMLLICVSVWFVFFLFVRTAALVVRVTSVKFQLVYHSWRMGFEQR